MMGEEMIRAQSHQWEMKYENIYLCINRERMRKSILSLEVRNHGFTYILHIFRVLQ